MTGTRRLRLERERSRDGLTDAVFAVDGSQRWRVQVRTTRGEPCRLTCRADQSRRPLRFELLELEPLDHAPVR